jgi:DNA-binding HxlR family transcriptional regulator
VERSEPRPCSIARSLELVGERWSLLVMREVLYGEHRFSAIAAGTGAPRDVLAARLRSLVDSGVLERRQYSDRPPRFEYHPTPRGRSLFPVLQALRQWGDDELGERPATFEHGDHDFVAALACGACGERVAAADIEPRGPAVAPR